MLDAGGIAALEAGKPLVYVSPPAAWAVAPLFAHLPPSDTAGPRLLVLAPDIPDVLDLARALRRLPGFEPVHPATGAARSGRLLGQEAVRSLVASPTGALQLVEMSRLRLDQLAAIALLWPELWAGGDHPVADSLLAEARQAQRVIATGDAEAVRDVVERHARRAPLAVAARVPERPLAGARYLVVDGEKRGVAIRAVLDTLDPEATLLWEPADDGFERWVEFGEDPGVTIAQAAPAERRFDVAVAAELPSAEVLAALAATARDVVVLVRASQIPYLQRIAHPLKSLRLAGPADHARERAHALRQAVRDRIASGDVAGPLLALGPLFDEYDPALVAAALARIGGTPEEAPAPLPAWVRVQVNVGRRDHVRPSDLVGALLNGVGLAKDHVGRIDIREHQATVEIRAQDAERAVHGLAQLTVRGRSLSARIVP
ncbi:MAG: DbpA RNA binding domain-containing protein [Gemmatimonadetes bacterium]|nr:DbpA RNA binding domain-containing protein [Gemmatimonadota bacterium]